MTENNKYELGCYGDGSFGPDHTRRKVFDIALNEGWQPPEHDKEIVDNDISYLDFWHNRGDIDMLQSCFITLQDLQELEGEAIDYLNEHCSDDSHYWGYEDGDFGYFEVTKE
jgi:hypothetical protein